jgi:nucleotide-binding universal stress UspA family protein
MAHVSKKILVATDFSPDAQHALEVAVGLAKQLGAALVLVHVLPEGGLDQATWAEGAFDRLSSRLEAVQRAWARLEPQMQASGVQVTMSTVDGEPVAALVRVAQECDCAMIVVGTHGRTGLRRLVLGSVAEGLIRRSPVPVLTARLP